LEDFKVRIKITLFAVALFIFNLCAGMYNSAKGFGNNQNIVSIVACEQDEGGVCKDVEIKPLMKSNGSSDGAGNPDKDVLIIIEGDKVPEGFLKLKSGKIVARTRLEEIPTDVFKYEIFPVLDVKGLMGVLQASKTLREEVEKFILREDISKIKKSFLRKVNCFGSVWCFSREDLVEEFVEKYVSELKQELGKSEVIPLLFVDGGRERLKFLNKNNLMDFIKKRNLKSELKQLVDKELGCDDEGFYKCPTCKGVIRMFGVHVLVFSAASVFACSLVGGILLIVELT
jgi:hypothetical protein